MHVREIIKNVSYDYLVKTKLIPELLCNNCIKKYPPFVYSNKDDDKFSYFGMLIDYIVRGGLRINIKQSVDLGIDPTCNSIEQFSEDKILNAVTQLNIYETSSNIYDITTAALYLVSILYDKKVYMDDNVKTYVPSIINMIKALVAKWKDNTIYLKGIIKYNQEYKYHDLFFGYILLFLLNRLYYLSI